MILLNLTIIFSQQERGGRRSGSSRRSSPNPKPAKTLFVINFDPINTRIQDLERHFEPYGKISNVRIRRNFAFVQFESQEDATKALEAANMRYFSLFLVLCVCSSKHPFKYYEYFSAYIIFFLDGVSGLQLCRLMVLGYRHISTACFSLVPEFAA